MLFRSQSDRQIARKLQPDKFIEVYCEATLEVCESRDPKGIYKKARAGKIKHFTGIDDPYEIPKSPEIEVSTGSEPLDVCVDQVIGYLQKQEIIH